MFNFVNSEKIQECFICCSIEGKSETEIKYEMIFNKKYMNYPLVLLSNSYGCKCCNSYAHNKCLLNINKCPTCRKVVLKPNLYVKTKYDYYLWFLLDWVKKDISRIEKIKWCAIVNIITIWILLYLFDKNKETIELIIPSKSYCSLSFVIAIGILWYGSVYTVILEDYFKKYWLYDSKNKKCYILN